jgi:prolyl-tRNA synthetase
MAKNLTTRDEDYSKWYNELVIKADLAENSGVRGCMVIKPYGFAIWEMMQAELDVDGFAKECAVVTHYRLKTAEDGSIVVDETAKLEEELIVRPTSETIIWDTYRKWIQSYRDLPLLINQWANVVRWEMRTRLFLRTTEFLWQEGHTAHATKDEAIAESEQMMNVYADFVENHMAVPVVKGLKTESERFAGALETYCIEALMQDGKALQAGTSHFLGQNFAKAFDVKFANKEGKQEYVWATSWGVSTRLMGALIMTHSDDNGLVLPPKLAPDQVVIVPIYRNDEQFDAVSDLANNLMKDLRAKGVRVKFDKRDTHKPGWKFNEYELKGVPLRIAIGPKDLEKGTVEMARRDTLTKEIVETTAVVARVEGLLEEIQDNLFAKAINYRTAHTTQVSSYDEFKKVLNEKGGFISAHWDGTSETEDKIKKETKATIRCIPLDTDNEGGTCIVTGNISARKVLFAKAY